MFNVINARMHRHGHIVKTNGPVMPDEASFADVGTVLHVIGGPFRSVIVHTV